MKTFGRILSVITIITVLATFMFAMPALASDELLTNGTFLNNAEKWTLGSTYLVTSLDTGYIAPYEGYQGNYINIGEKANVTSDAIKGMEIGKTYKLSFWHKSGSGSGVVIQYYQLHVNADGATVDLGSVASAYRTFITPAATNGEWQYYETTIIPRNYLTEQTPETLAAAGVSTEGEYSTGIYFMLRNTTGTGNNCYADMSFKEQINLFSNEKFNFMTGSTPDGWTLGGTASVGFEAGHGNYLELSCASTTNMASQTVNLTVGKRYKITFDFKTTSTTPTTPNIRISYGVGYIEYAGTTYIADNSPTEGNGKLSISNNPMPTISTNNWTPAEFTFIVPAYGTNKTFSTTLYFKVVANLIDSESAAAKHCYDNIVLEEVKSGAEFLNSSGEKIANLTANETVTVNYEYACPVSEYTGATTLFGLYKKTNDASQLMEIYPITDAPYAVQPLKAGMKFTYYIPVTYTKTFTVPNDGGSYAISALCWNGLENLVPISKVQSIATR